MRAHKRKAPKRVLLPSIERYIGTRLRAEKSPEQLAREVVDRLLGEIRTSR